MQGLAERDLPVTVVVPSKNRWPLLRHTLDTILAQRGVEVRVILVDDGSSEPYEPHVAKLQEPRIALIRTTGLGLSAARNTGLAASRTPWTAFSDDDDLWAPDKLLEQMAALTSHPDAKWCFCGTLQFDEAGEFVNVQRAEAGPELHTRLLSGNCIPGGGSAIVARTQTLLSAGGFDESLRYAEDWEAWVRLSAQAPAVAVDRPLLAYRVHTRSMSFVAPAFAAMRTIEARYEDERKASGVAFDWSGLYYTAGILAAGTGDRRAAFLNFSKAGLRGRVWRQVILGGVALVAPRLVYRRARREAATQVPAAWASEVSQWLTPVLRDEAGSR